MSGLIHDNHWQYPVPRSTATAPSQALCRYKVPQEGLITEVTTVHIHKVNRGERSWETFRTTLGAVGLVTKHNCSMVSSHCTCFRAQVCSTVVATVIPVCSTSMYVVWFTLLMKRAKGTAEGWRGSVHAQNVSA